MKFEDVLPAKRGKLTHARLLEILNYNQKTGVFIWAAHTSCQSRIKIGSIAGGDDGQGYTRITIDGIAYAAHRLAWFYVNGEWPVDCIDHINGKRNDNTITNLRVVSVRENNQNIGAHRKGRLVGASWHKGVKKWQAQIKLNGKRKGLGLFSTELEAHQAYMRALEVGTQPNGAVLVPCTEREEKDPFALTPEEKANLPEEELP